MSDLISREALREDFYELEIHGTMAVKAVLPIIEERIDNLPAVDAVEVVHGRWALETRSFYMDTFDESCELAVYILASCSECGRKHPDTHQVFSKTLYAPEGADDEFRFDQKAEQEKALVEFMQRGYNFATYCPNCGARMDGE